VSAAAIQSEYTPKAAPKRRTRINRKNSHGKETAIVVGVGAEQGVGGAVCPKFAAEGHHVYVAGRTEAKIAKVVETILKAGGSAEAVKTDAAKEDEVAALFDLALSSAKRAPPDLIVFNAGNNKRVPFREVSVELFEDFWRVGLCVPKTSSELMP
jgi:NAD(P)-dependent dehydrogenase (short-subunit alcohol dehydrogenase family)